jgi:hypothetical protein
MTPPLHVAARAGQDLHVLAAFAADSTAVSSGHGAAVLSHVTRYDPEAHDEHVA